MVCKYCEEAIVGPETHLIHVAENIGQYCHELSGIFVRCFKLLNHKHRNVTRTCIFSMAVAELSELTQPFCDEAEFGDFFGCFI